MAYQLITGCSMLFYYDLSLIVKDHHMIHRLEYKYTSRQQSTLNLSRADKDSSLDF